MLKEWAEIGQSISLILASLFAIYGVDAWRREFVGKRRMELAEEVLALFYQARDNIDSIRSSFGFGHEGATRKPDPNERPEHKDALDQAYALIERYNRYSEVFARIHALRYRFMALFGSEAAKPFDELNCIVNELILSARRKARLTTVPDWSLRSEAAIEKHTKNLLEIERIYYSGGEDDPIVPRVAKVVESMEATCRAIIENHGTLFGLINARLWSRNG